MRAVLCEAQPFFLLYSYNPHLRWMLFAQFLLLSSTLLTFGTLLVLLKLAIRLIPDSHSYPFLPELDKATDVMDPNTILAFIVGLVASIGVLIYLNAGSKYDVDICVFHTHSVLRAKTDFGSQRVAALQIDGEEANFRKHSLVPLPITIGQQHLGASYRATH